MTETEMRNLRLECLRFAKGDIDKAIEMYEWVVKFPQAIIPVPAPGCGTGCGTIVIPVAKTNWDT